MKLLFKNSFNYIINVISLFSTKIWLLPTMFKNIVISNYVKKVLTIYTLSEGAGGRSPL